MESRSLTLALPVVFLAAMASGCGSGTFGIFAASDSSSSSGNGAPAVSQFEVEGHKVPAAEIRFTASDPEGDPVVIEFCYEAENELTGMIERELMTRIPANPATFAADRDGEEHTVLWDFAGEANLPDDARYKEPVSVIAILPGGQEIVVGGSDFGVGNDPPVITMAGSPGAEVAGNVLVLFTVEDTSDDAVDIRVEFYDDTTGLWQDARPGGIPDDANGMPGEAFVGIEANRNGTLLTFVWDTDRDLPDLERDVMVRFTPDDRTAAGAPVATPMFRVDNNDDPLAVLDEGQILANPDRRRGIPLPFEVFDEEGDATQVVVQWRRPGESFPELGSVDPARLSEILADPEERREYHIATEYPVPAGGLMAPLELPMGSTRVRLPELGSTASRLLADGIVGRELEILWPTKVPEPVADGWSVDELRAPVDVLPLDGPRALVLEGGGRLVWMDLATGETDQEVPIPGTPNAMAFEPGARAVVIATNTGVTGGGTWQLVRVDLDDLHVTDPPLATADDGLTERGRIRGLVCLGRDEALITVGSSLVHVRYPAAGPPRAVALLEDLEEPWGVLVDPRSANRIYMAEAGAGRVSTFTLDERGQEVAVRGLDRPTSIAFDLGTSRLLVVTGPGQNELSGVDLGAVGGNIGGFPIAQLNGRAEGMATGPDGVRVVALTNPDDLAVGGGVQQRRTILSYDPADLAVVVDRPFAPELKPLTPWRVTPSVETITASASGTRRSFVWDSADLQGEGKVLFRVLAVDTEAGIATESLVSKEVLTPFELAENAQILGEEGVTDGPVAGLAADLDDDGDLDLVSANARGHDLTIFFKDAEGFGLPVTLDLGGVGVCDDPQYAFCFPLGVAAGDLDGDGDLDLVTANNTRNDLTVFRQVSPGVFDSTTPAILGGPGVTRLPSAVVVADLNGDGLADVVSANGGASGAPPVNAPTLGTRAGARRADAPSEPALSGGPVDAESGRKDDLTIFFQTASGLDPEPTVLKSTTTTGGPRAVAAGDLDGDGDLDLVTANARGNNLSVYLQPAGGFVDADAPSVVVGDVTTTNRPRSVAVADLDQDGDLDLVSANLGPVIPVGAGGVAPFGSNVTIFFQPPGGFQQGAQPDRVLGEVSLTQDPSFVIPADLDGDGDLDLAATVQALDSATTSSNLAFYFQTDPGVFSPPRLLGDANATGSPAALVAADLNRDGGLDLVSFNSAENLPVSGNDLTVFYQVEPGRPDLAPAAFGDFSLLLDVQSADLDGDGDLDLLAGDRGFNRELKLFSQRSPGVFDDGVVVASEVGMSSQTIGDLDGDGDLDVAVARFPEFMLETYLRSESGELVPSPTLLGPTIVPLDLKAVDLDGDGDNDLLSANVLGIPGALPPNLSVFIQESPGAFDPLPLTLVDDDWSASSQFQSFAPHSVVAADLDGDGDLDLATENATFAFSAQVLNDNPGGSLTLFLQESPGTSSVEFGRPREIATSTTRRPGEIDVADLDGDGDLDLFTANSLGDDLTVYYQDTPGHFADAVVLGGPQLTNNPAAIEAADLDQDGVLELISANFGRSTAPVNPGPRGNVTIFEQDGVGNFDPTPVTLVAPTIDGATHLVVTDLDGDGEPDLIVGDALTRRITVFYSGRD